MRCVAVGFLFVQLSQVACAQEGADALGVPAVGDSRSREAVDALDVVRLRDGGMLRGTISELDPDDRVVIRLTTGELRQYPMSEVSYAGPAAEMRSPPPRSQVELETGDQVQLRIHGDGLGLHRQSLLGVRVGRTSAEVAAYSPLCVAPCETTIPRGTYQFAVTAPNSNRFRRVRGHTVLTRDGDLELAIRQPRALRIVGALIGLLGGVLTAAWYSQLATYDSVSDSGWTRSFVAGTVGLVVSVIGFTMLIFARPRGVVGVRAQ